jgi:ribosomal protein L19E
MKSSVVETDTIDIKSPANSSIIDLNKREKQRKLSRHSSTDQNHGNELANPSATTTYKHQSITSTG